MKDADPAGSTGVVQTLFRGVLRYVLILAAVSLLTAGLAFLWVAVWDASPERAFPLTFFIAGSFIAIVGFLGAGGGSPQTTPLIREATTSYDFSERLRAENKALVYGSVGVGLIVIGVVLDSFL